MVTRLAKSWLTSPEIQTDSGRLHLTVPVTVARPVLVLTDPTSSTVRLNCRGGNTVIRKLPSAWLPERSVAVHVTVVSPTGNSAPDGGSQVVTGAGSRSSCAQAL